MRGANILHLGVKELRGLGRNAMLLVLVVYAFTVAIYIGSKAMPETLNRAPIAIVDEDPSSVSSDIQDAFYLCYFLPPKPIAQPEMDLRMDAGLDTFALDIPHDSSATCWLGVAQHRRHAHVAGFTGGGYVQSIVNGEIEEFLAHHRTQHDCRWRSTCARFNPELDKAWFGAINEMIEAITMLSVILTGAALIREHGTIEHLLVMPVTAFEIMAGKIWSMGLVVSFWSFIQPSCMQRPTHIS